MLSIDQRGRPGVEPLCSFEVRAQGERDYPLGGGGEGGVLEHKAKGIVLNPLWLDGVVQ